jgi:WD40 repeat protein
LHGQTQNVSKFEFTPDGAKLIAVHFDGSTEMWHTATLRKVDGWRLAGKAYAVAVHPSGKWIATVGDDIRVFNPDGRQLHAFPAPKTNNGVVGLFFQPGTDNMIAAQSFEGLQIIRLGAGAPTIESIRDKVMTYNLVFNPDGTQIATTGPGPLDVTVFRFPQLEPLHVLRGHTASPMHFRFSPDGKRLATAATDGTLRLWDLASGQEVLTLDTPPCFDIAFSADGQRLAAGGPGAAIRVWDASRGAKADGR